MSLSPQAIFYIGLGVIFLSAVLPVALGNFFDADTTGWDTGTIALWGIIPIAVIALVVLHFVPSGGRKGA